MLDGADLVVVRILGGYRSWQDGIDTIVGSGVPTLVVSGEQAPDAELMSHSTVPAGVAVQAHIYLAQGGVENLRQLHAFLCDTVLMTGFGFGPPVITPSWGILDRPAVDSAGPTIAVLYYRAQQLAGNTGYIEALCSAIEDAGGRPLPVYCASLRTAEPDDVGAAEIGRRDGDHRAGRGGRSSRRRVGRRQRRHLERGTPCRTGHPDPAGALPDQLAVRVARQRRRSQPARRRDAGGGARVRRAHHHGPVLLQGD